MNLIYDLDGTIADTSKDVIECLRNAYSRAIGLQDIFIEKSIIGPPVNEMINTITPGLSEKEFEMVMYEFRRLYDSSMYPFTVLFKDVYLMINEFSHNQINQFVATNKPKVPTKKIINKFNFSCFKDVITPDYFADIVLSKKDMILHLIKKWNLDNAQTIMIGDGVSDMIGAKENKIKTICFLGGYGKKEDLLETDPDFIIKEIKEIKQIIKEL